MADPHGGYDWGPCTVHASPGAACRNDVRYPPCRNGCPGPHRSSCRSSFSGHDEHLFVLDIFLDPEHLIFAYLVPTTLIAIGYGSTAAMLTSIAGVILAAYFLYPPTFSFYLTQPLHVAELVFFTLLALAASQVVAKITDVRRKD